MRAPGRINSQNLPLVSKVARERYTDLWLFLSPVSNHIRQVGRLSSRIKMSCVVKHGQSKVELHSPLEIFNLVRILL